MLELINKFQAKDKTIKGVYKNEKGEIVEISLLMNKKHDVLVVPTHHFCNLGCIMCHLTNDKVKKEMTKVIEEELMSGIYDMMIDSESKITNKDKLLISFMGVGEPLLNMDLLYNMFNNQDALKKLGYTDICYAISTMMPNDNIKGLTDVVNKNDIALKIHYSMHTSDSNKRKKIIPSSNVTIDNALIMLNQYRDTVKNNKNIVNTYKKFHRSFKPTEIHYTLMNDINDSKYELAYLIYFLDRYKIPLKFLSFNPKNDLEKSTHEDEWMSMIKEYIKDVRVRKYSPPGKGIGSSCGEFTKHYYFEEVETEEEKCEFDKWCKKYTLK